MYKHYKQKKRRAVAWILLVAIAMFCALPIIAAHAEVMDIDPAPAILFDLTDVLIAVALAVGGFVWRKWVRPWLLSRQLMDEAEIVVNAVEALIGRGHGTEKWKYAVEKMKEYGFKVDSEIVLDALRAAWRKLNTEQMQSGEKEKPHEQ